MPRTSPVHYIVPSTISITPNANNSPDDLAVFVARGAKIKVFSRNAGIDTENAAYQEWTLAGLNRRLAESDKPYTIYARLSKSDKENGYVVFAPQTLRDGVWIDKYSSVTTDGLSALYQENGIDVKVDDPNFWYVRLGHVTLPDDNLRAVVLDTGILGTDQYNEDWELDPDVMPLRVELSCKVNAKDVGMSPYLYWGEYLQMTASLVRGWAQKADVLADRWTIMRNTGDSVADAAWNFPGSSIVIGDNLPAEYEAREMPEGLINLDHYRDDDDFDGTVAAVFTVTAWKQDDETFTPLARTTITIMTEVAERYELVLSTGNINYNPDTDTYTPQEGINLRVRATDQKGNTVNITQTQFENMGLHAEYAPVDSDLWQTLVFQGISSPLAEANLPVSAFKAGKSLNVRLMRVISSDSSSDSSILDADEKVVELHRVTIAFLRDGENSREREWIFLRSAQFIDFDDEESASINPALIDIGEVNPEGAAEAVTDDKNQDQWVPQGWWNHQLGVDENNQFEYGSFRDFIHDTDSSDSSDYSKSSDYSDSSDSSNNTRAGHWSDFSTPRLWSHYGEDAYTVQANPPIVSFNCEATGKSTDNSTQEVALSMYRGAEPVQFQAVVTRMSHCMAWLSDSILSVSTGTAWQHENLVLYTAKNNPSEGNIAYDFSNNMEYVVTGVGSNYIQVSVNDTTVRLTRLDNVSYHDLSKGGNVTVTLTSGNISRVLIIPVTGSKQGYVGKPGSVGPMLYPAGQWEPKTYTANGDSRPYVLFDDGKYYYLNADSASETDIPGPDSSVWTEMTQVDVVYAKFGIMDYGMMASAVFCGDWMYSQYGRLYTDTEQFYVVDDVAHSSDPSHWRYNDAYTFGTDTAVPFAWFDPNYPQGGAEGKFAPTWAVNLKTGAMYISPGKTMQQVVQDLAGVRGDVEQLQDDVDNLTTGNENLLRNSGFTGDYIVENVVETTSVNADTPMYSDPLAHWSAAEVTVIDTAVSVTGKAVSLNNGSLLQTLHKSVEAGKNYIFSFRGFGSQITISVGGYTKTVTLTSDNTRHNVKFQAEESGNSFAVTDATGTLMELQLVEGIIPNTDWINSPLDNDKTLAYYQNITYLANAIANASTQVLGGLVLSQMIKVGNYRDGQMTQETGGMSGLFNSPNSPFLWGGGTLEKALYTIARYAANPLYDAPENEVKNLMAQFVITHGGQAILNDIIARGFIIATSGIFKNIMSPNGNFKIDEKGDMNVRNATISGNMYAPLFIIDDGNYNQCTKPTSDPYSNYRIIDLEKTGLNIQINAREEYTATGLFLPDDQKYKGAIMRIFNNTKRMIAFYGVTGRNYYSQGSLQTSTIENSIFSLEPHTYIILQCEYFERNTNIEYRRGYPITHTDNMRKLEDVQVGDKIKVVGGIVDGSGGYKVYGGTDDSPENILFHDSIQETSVRDRVLGFETEYIVGETPSCDAIYANVASGTTAQIYLFKYNKVPSCKWISVNELSNLNEVEMPTSMSFYSYNKGASMGAHPYIDSNGFLRFSNWTRTDNDGAIRNDS